MTKKSTFLIWCEIELFLELVFSTDAKKEKIECVSFLFTSITLLLLLLIMLTHGEQTNFILPICVYISVDQ